MIHFVYCKVSVKHIHVIYLATYPHNLGCIMDQYMHFNDDIMTVHRSR